MNNETFCVTDYGAIASDTILQTKAIQSAIDDCFRKGGGVVEIPAGTYRTGGIRIRSNVTLYLKSGATLLGSRDPEDYFEYLDDVIEPLTEEALTKFPRLSYTEVWSIMREQGNEHTYYQRYYQKPARRWNNALIRAIHAENIAIIGEPGSMIDGADCYDDLGEEGYRGPHGITMHDCKNILFKGYTMQNSSNWGHNIVRCTNVSCKNLTVLAGHDGVHFTQCHNVDVRDSEFHTGDDCIAGFANINFTVKNCKVNSSCNGFRIGGTNVFIKDCYIYGPGRFAHRYFLTEEEKRAGKQAIASEIKGARNNMVSAVTYYADFSFPIEERPSNIVIQDCVIENTDRFLHYNYSGNEVWQKQRPLGDITFRNIKAKNIKMPINAYGDANDPVTITLENIDISDSAEFSAEALIHACHFKRIVLENITLASVPCKMLLKRWSNEGNIEVRDIRCDLPEDAYVCDAKEDFYSATV